MPDFELTFRPGVTTSLHVDADELLFCAAHPAVPAVPDPRHAILEALAHPIGTPRLAEMLKPDQRVTILVDDTTRPTPTAAILPPVLDTIHQAGVSDDRICIFACIGTHRPMTGDELKAKLGSAIVSRYPVINRDYRMGDFVSLGSTPNGIPIEVDRAVVEADFRIAIGNVIPHIAAGWGGGSKMILPGCCSQRTSDRMHYASCVMQPVLEVVGTRDNRARGEMDAVAGSLGLDFIVNTVLNEAQEILGVFAGHYVAAHRAAVACAEQLMVVPIPRQADIVIVSANPCHVDYWQGIKPLINAQRAVRPGGVVIFLLDGSEGLSGDAPAHEPVLRRYMNWSARDIQAAVDRGEITDLAGVSVPLYHAAVRERVTTICVTNNLTAEDIATLGFLQAPSAQAALNQARALLGPGGSAAASVGVIPFGGETLTRIEALSFQQER